MIVGFSLLKSNDLNVTANNRDHVFVEKIVENDEC